MDIKVQKIKTDWTIMPGGLTWFIVGQPKSGKTTAASSWSEKGNEGVLIFDIDSGADFVDGANVIPITTLNTPTKPKLSLIHI